MNYLDVKNILKKNNCDLVHLKSTDSTMNEAKNFLKKNPSSLAIIADMQNEGRGRLGNKWISPKGNIYCSLALYNGIPLNEYFSFIDKSFLNLKSLNTPAIDLSNTETTSVTPMLKQKYSKHLPSSRRAECFFKNRFFCSKLMFKNFYAGFMKKKN